MRDLIYAYNLTHLMMGGYAFHLILPLTVQYDFLHLDENVKSLTCKLLLCSIKR